MLKIKFVKIDLKKASVRATTNTSVTNVTAHNFFKVFTLKYYKKALFQK